MLEEIKYHYWIHYGRNFKNNILQIYIHNASYSRIIIPLIGRTQEMYTPNIISIEGPMPDGRVIKSNDENFKYFIEQTIMEHLI